MASIRSYPNGAGGSTGATLATVKPLLTSGVIYYVGNSVAGASDSNAGTERTAPFLTVGHAISVAVAYDTIDILAGHSETVSSILAVAVAGLSIVGEGSGSTVPRLTNGVAAATNPMFKITAKGCLIANLYFPTSSVVARERIMVEGGSGTSFLQDLTFECGANDGQRSLYYDSVGPDFGSGLIFTSVAATPAQGIQMTTTTNLFFDDITLDGGSFGWGSNGAVYGGSAAVGLRWTNVRLLNGSNINLVTGTTGAINVVQATGDSQVNWTP